MEEYYLTHDIRLINNKMEYRKNDIFIPIKKSNWHHVLSDYGWEKIYKSWITVKIRRAKRDLSKIGS